MLAQTSLPTIDVSKLPCVYQGPLSSASSRFCDHETRLIYTTSRTNATLVTQTLTLLLLSPGGRFACTLVHKDDRESSVAVQRDVPSLICLSCRGRIVIIGPLPNSPYRGRSLCDWTCWLGIGPLPSFPYYSRSHCDWAC